MNAFWQGVIAGYGIAIPVGAIAVLIIDLALRPGVSARVCGWGRGGQRRLDLCRLGRGGWDGAGHGPAPLRLVAGLGQWRCAGGAGNERGVAGVAGAANHRRPGCRAARPSLAPAGVPAIPRPDAAQSSYSRLLRGPGPRRKPRVKWNAGQWTAVRARRGLASLSWQTLLAAVGSLLGKRLPPRARLITSLVGNMVVIALGVRILVQARGGA